MFQRAIPADSSVRRRRPSAGQQAVRESRIQTAPAQMLLVFVILGLPDARSAWRRTRTTSFGSSDLRFFAFAVGSCSSTVNAADGIPAASTLHEPGRETGRDRDRRTARCSESRASAFRPSAAKYRRFLWITRVDDSVAALHSNSIVISGTETAHKRVSTAQKR